MGSNKVLRVALGHGEEDEYKKGLSALAEDISGSIGLFFTGLPQDQVPIPLLLQCHFRRQGCGYEGQSFSIAHALVVTAARSA